MHAMAGPRPTRFTRVAFIKPSISSWASPLRKHEAITNIVLTYYMVQMSRTSTYKRWTIHKSRKAAQTALPICHQLTSPIQNTSIEPWGEDVLHAVPKNSFECISPMLVICPTLHQQGALGKRTSRRPSFVQTFP